MTLSVYSVYAVSDGGTISDKRVGKEVKAVVPVFRHYSSISLKASKRNKRNLSEDSYLQVQIQTRHFLNTDQRH
jgi:hypothetical protein